MIANVSPNSSSCEHTLNTLRYADRVKGSLGLMLYPMPNAVAKPGYHCLNGSRPLSRAQEGEECKTAGLLEWRLAQQQCSSDWLGATCDRADQASCPYGGCQGGALTLLTLCRVGRCTARSQSSCILLQSSLHLNLPVQQTQCCHAGARLCTRCCAVSHAASGFAGPLAATRGCTQSTVTTASRPATFCHPAEEHALPCSSGSQTVHHPRKATITGPVSCRL